MNPSSASAGTSNRLISTTESLLASMRPPLPLLLQGPISSSPPVRDPPLRPANEDQGAAVALNARATTPYRASRTQAHDAAAARYEEQQMGAGTLGAVGGSWLRRLAVAVPRQVQDLIGVLG